MLKYRNLEAQIGQFSMLKLNKTMNLQITAFQSRLYFDLWDNGPATFSTINLVTVLKRRKLLRDDS